MLRAKITAICRASLLTIVVGWLLQGVAFAHQFGGPNDPCERKIGKLADSYHFLSAANLIPTRSIAIRFRAPEIRCWWSMSSAMTCGQLR